MNKQKIIGGLIGLILLSLIGYKYYEFKYPSPEVGVESKSSTKESSSELSNTNSSKEFSKDTSGFKVEVDKPINGIYKGVIEVGASGFNMFVVEIDKDKNWSLEVKQFGKSLAYEGFATTEDFKKGLKDYIATAFDKGTNGKNIHFVISSGALKNPKTELIAKAIEQMGYRVNRVTPEQEGQYAFRALVPKKYRDESFSVDIGSGNTKISWMENGRIKSLEGPGAKFYQTGMSMETATKEIADLMAKVPSNKKSMCFIIGGVPFTMAEQGRNNQERFTFLNSPDSYEAGNDIKFKSGLTIYNAIWQNSDAKDFIFDWDANFTVGFLLSLN